MGKITIEAYTLVISNKSGILQMELLNYFSHSPHDVLLEVIFRKIWGEPLLVFVICL